MSTAKTMAAVLAGHQDWTYLIARNAMVCAGRGCGWTKALTEDESSRDAYLSHQAAVLSAAGFGLVADAKAEALEEAADHAEAFGLETVNPRSLRNRAANLRAAS